MEILRGGLWHTTSESRWNGIDATGRILVKPPVPDNERHGTSSYARSLGGVSLFDFVDFDYEAYKRNCQVNHVAAFVPVYSAWEAAVWIEIDPSTVSVSLTSARDLHARGNKREPTGIGSLALSREPTSATSRARRSFASCLFAVVIAHSRPLPDGQGAPESRMESGADLPPNAARSG